MSVMWFKFEKKKKNIYFFIPISVGPQTTNKNRPKMLWLNMIGQTLRKPWKDLQMAWSAFDQDDFKR